MAAQTVSICPICSVDIAKAKQALGGIDITQCPNCQFPVLLIANKYKLIQVLGQGGFGTVYLAKHIHLVKEAERVIKILPPNVFNLKNMSQRFFREVQLTSLLSQKDEHIVRVYDDFGALPGNLGHFYVMEFLQGVSLDALLRDPQRLPSLDFCFYLFLQLCEAMEHAHNEGVVHRDLKPDNLYLVRKKDDKNFLKVLDFGIARPLNHDDLKRSGMTQGAIGTPFYMAPEQCTNGDVGPGTDIYAMGIILYEMLTGYTPFDKRREGPTNQSMVEIMMANVNETPTPPIERNPTRVTPALNSIIMKMLEKHALDRFQSAKELKSALIGAFPPLTPEHILQILPFPDMENYQQFIQQQLPSGEEEVPNAPNQPNPGALPNAKTSRMDALKKPAFKQKTIQQQERKQATKKLIQKKATTPHQNLHRAAEEHKPTSSRSIERDFMKASERKKALFLAILLLVGIVGGSAYLLKDVFMKRQLKRKKNNPHIHSRKQISRKQHQIRRAPSAETQLKKYKTLQHPISTSCKKRHPSAYGFVKVDLLPGQNEQFRTRFHKRHQGISARAQTCVQQMLHVSKDKLPKLVSALVLTFDFGKQPKPPRRRIRRRRPIIRKKPKTAPAKNTPKPLQVKSFAGCPPDSKGTWWSKLTFLNRNIQPRLKIRGQAIKKRLSDGICIQLSKPATMVFSYPGYFPCFLRMQPTNQRWKIKLKVATDDTIAPTSNYCRR